MKAISPETASSARPSSAVATVSPEVRPWWQTVQMAEPPAIAMVCPLGNSTSRSASAPGLWQAVHSTVVPIGTA